MHPDPNAVLMDPGGPSTYTLWAVTDGTDLLTSANLGRWAWSPGTLPGAGQSLPETNLRVWQGIFAGLIKGSTSSSPRRVWLGGGWDTPAVRYDDAIWSSSYTPLLYNRGSDPGCPP